MPGAHGGQIPWNWSSEWLRATISTTAFSPHQVMKLLIDTYNFNNHKIESLIWNSVEFLHNYFSFFETGSCCIALPVLELSL